MYYTRNSYIITYKVNGTFYESGDYKYEATVNKEAKPTKAGYTFNGWNNEPDTMPAHDVTASGEFVANTDTEYKVEYYLQNLDQNGYKLEKTVPEKGTTGEKVKAAIESFTGFTFDKNNSENKLEGTISGDGSLVLKVYYNRNKYTITYTSGEHGTFEDQRYEALYGAETPAFSGDITAEEGYEFAGWDPKVATTVSGDATYKATYNATRIEGTLIANIKCNYPTEDGVKAEPGNTLKYTITLEESGDISEYPKEIKIKLDDDVEGPTEPLSNAVYDKTTHTITWTVESENDQLKYSVKVKKDTPAGEKVETTITGAEAKGDKLVDVEATVAVKVDKNKNIVLVLDVSGSMNYCLTHGKDKGHFIRIRWEGIIPHSEYCSEKSRLEVMQEAAKNFAKSIIDERNSEDITITIITFGSSVSNKGTLINPKAAQVNAVIDKLSADGGTNMRGAIEVATTVLNDSLMLDNAVDYVVVLSDGEPSYGYSCDTATLNAFYATKANAYAIGFGNNYNENELLKIVNNDSSKLFDAADADKLEDAFRKIGSEINKAQTSEGKIDVSVEGIKLYPIKLAYQNADSQLVDVIVKESGDLESNHLSITEDGKLVWNISEYPGCTGFQIEVDRTKTTATHMLFEKEYGLKDVILVYGDPTITDELPEDEEIVEPSTSESGDVKVENPVSGESETEPSTSESGDVKVEEPVSGESDTKPATSESGDSANEEQNVVKEEQVKEEAQEPQIEENEQQEEKEQEETIKNAEEEAKPTTEEAVALEIKDPLENEEQDEEAA